jgi:hypothetical protein
VKEWRNRGRWRCFLYVVWTVLLPSELVGLVLANESFGFVQTFINLRDGWCCRGRETLIIIALGLVKCLR